MEGHRFSLCSMIDIWVLLRLVKFMSPLLIYRLFRGKNVGRMLRFFFFFSMCFLDSKNKDFNYVMSVSENVFFSPPRFRPVLLLTRPHAYSDMMPPLEAE